MKITKFDKWVCYCLAVFGIGLHLKMVFKSLMNHRSIVMDAIGLILWIAYLITIRFTIKKKERELREKEMQEDKGNTTM